ncbi:hypothetical protein FRB99_002923, partial [Tulasnella sp. 403]
LEHARGALASLQNLGFTHITTPEQLFEKFAEVDPVDEVLEVMANVEAYLDIASMRFVDYISLNTEHYLVNVVGEKINAAVLADLDLDGEGIRERCSKWMMPNNVNAIASAA